MSKKLPIRYFSRVWFLLFCLGTYYAIAQIPPPGFASVTVSDQWNEAVGLVFNDSGSEMFVWERGGKVWVVSNGQKFLVLDISEEVGGWHDHGLLGFALHPQFELNGHIYLLYLVDRHHLINHGTGAYSPTVNDFFSATIGRLTRYTLAKTGASYTVLQGSRKVLIGETRSDGFVSLERSHGAGSLVFGTDQTLLVSTGDGAHGAAIDAGSAPGTYFAQALADGTLTPELNVGAFRSQILDCLNGKILRIDPETGQGIPSNPFYDPSRPNAAISKVWALGARQPFRMSLKPGTGSHNPSEGNPGILYFGDVGFATWEELNVVDRPGLNFGWPIYEGLTPSTSYSQLNTPNMFEPNPLYQVNGCTQRFFYFQDLLKEATPSGVADFINPCGLENIPSSTHTFMHTRPIIDWRHSPSGPSRTGIFNGQTATVVNIGAPGSPVAGPQFGGNAAVGGIFYTGTDFPEEFRNKYFFGDYAMGWIRSISVSETNQPLQVNNFVGSGSVVVGMATHPAHEGLYYVNFPSQIRRIYYSSNRPPVAIASSDLSYGPSPLIVQFTGDQSTDPEELPLSYEWNFGDGSSFSSIPNPIHTFVSGGAGPSKFTVTLKVTDNLGVESRTTLEVSVNNTPPQVTIKSPVDGTLYPLTGDTIYPLTATVDDLEHTSEQLTYEWQTTLHHGNHSHPEPVDTSPETSTSISPLGCNEEIYFYVIKLTVTDAAGASTTKEVRLYPDCENVVKVTPLITWSNPSAITVGTALSSTQLNATAGHNGTPVAGVFTYTPGAGTVLGEGVGQQLSVNFVPSDGTLYNSVGKTVIIDVNAVATSAFYRAININGPALAIDGNSWISSTGAPNFSFTTNFTVFNSQNVTLIPATDVNRATMIRSSVWGNTVTLTVSAVPVGTYQVWLYVWEDNFPQTFSVLVEGAVVEPNYNSGPAGTWRKLGPYIATINDGTLVVSTSGQHANASGIEIWRAGPPPANRPPVVANAISDQSGTVGSPFSYTFPQNTFSDPDAGTTLTYSSVLDSGEPLPGWLTFTGSSRNFSGTPTASNLGSQNIRVTASDGAGGSVSDVFMITVNPFVKVTPLITWSNPSAITVGTALSSTQLNATAGHNGTPVAGVFTYTPGAGTVLGEGVGQQLSVNFVPSDGTLYNSVGKTVIIDVNAVATSAFYRAININGPALAIDGNSWISSTGAPNFSFTTNFTVFNSQNVTLIPATDVNRATMIRSSVWGNTVTLTVSAVPVGTYQVWLYVWEDNFPQTFSVLVEGAVVEPNYNSGPAGTWRKLGPYIATINDGTLVVSTSGQHANASGIEIWRAGPPPANRPPVVANAISDQSGTVGSPFSYTFPQNTFSDPDAGTTLTYSSVLDSGEPLPGWLTFTGSSRNFSGTPTASNLGSQNIRVTASDGAGGSVSDVFMITVNPFVKVTPLITWSNPSAITVGTALSSTQLNATAGHNGTPVAGVFTYTPPAGTVLELGTGQELSVDFSPTDAILYNPASKTVMIDVNEVVKVTPSITWSNPFAITVGTALSSTQLNATAGHNGTPVAGVFTYTPPAGTVLELGTGQELSVDFSPTDAILYNPASKTVMIDVNEVVKVTPSITWSNPFAITVGTALSSTQLNATASHNGTPVAGVFTYTPGAGTVLGEGVGQQLSVNFVPSDGTLYNSVGKTVIIDVNAVATSAFYRAININGPALAIDGNSWISSTGAPNFSFTTNFTVFNSQNVTLIPATDVNRATMIRSSVWGNTVTLTVSAVPVGTYQVWLYVWEDNFPQTFSVLVEGAVVEPNYNSGPAGTWRKLGPYTATINDGTLVVSTSGQHANASGIEIWRAGPPPANRPPVVANAISDQSGTVGSPFSYTFPQNTFSDPDAGTTLIYSSVLDSGEPLPGWLTFTGSSRNFSGTPTASNLGSQNIRVTASDGAGGSVSDVFMITVNPFVKVTPLITWSNPSAITVGTALSSTQLNATAGHNGTPVAGVFTYTPGAGTVLGEGVGQQLSVNFVPSDGTLYNSVGKTVIIDVNAVATSAFYRAININGPALAIDGNSWISSTGAPNFSFTTNFTVFNSQNVTLIPATDVNRATMIRSSVWGNTVTLTVSAVPVGTYQVWLYVWEDNFPQTFSVLVEGAVVESNYNSGPAGTWRKLGPYTATINDGTLVVSTSGQHANVSGIEIWTFANQSARESSAARMPGSAPDEEHKNEIQLIATPNPFSNRLNIGFTPTQSGSATLELYDLRGLRIHLLYEGLVVKGERKEQEFEPIDLVNGPYILQLENGKIITRIKLMQLK